MTSRRQKLPTTVLERAKAAAEAVPARRPAPAAKAPATKAAKPNATRAKVVAALKKLHPMD
jgi:hypothetical protein